MRRTFPIITRLLLPEISSTCFGAGLSARLRTLMPFTRVPSALSAFCLLRGRRRHSLSSCEFIEPRREREIEDESLSYERARIALRPELYEDLTGARYANLRGTAGRNTRALDFTLARPFAAGWEPEQVAAARHYAGIKPGDLSTIPRNPECERQCVLLFFSTITSHSVYILYPGDRCFLLKRKNSPIRICTKSRNVQYMGIDRRLQNSENFRISSLRNGNFTLSFSTDNRRVIRAFGDNAKPFTKYIRFSFFFSLPSWWVYKIYLHSIRSLQSKGEAILPVKRLRIEP